MKRGETLVVGSDHAGFKLKEYVKNRLEEMGYRIEDVGTYGEDPVDYPDFAEKVALRVLNGRNRRGILACGTGIGASIAANKIPGIRAALVYNVEEARLSREHNDANLLVLGGWRYKKQEVAGILRTWLRGRFRRGRHLRRIRKITRLEKKYGMRSPSGRRR